MVIAQIFTHESFQMPFMQYDHVIQQVPSATPNPTLGDSVLPRTAKGGSHGRASQARGKGDHVAAELRIMIEQQKVVGRRVWPGLSQLLHDPETVRISRRVQVQNSAAVMADDEETIQEAEGERREREKSHGWNWLAGVAKKTKPALANIRASGCPPQPTRDGGLGYLEAEFE